MKRLCLLLMAIVFILTLAACGEDSKNYDIYSIDYNDAVSFERDLNNGVKTKGKIVQFWIEEYAPGSILGINCHAGEHLNFIFDNELDVEAGDTIIVAITEEPSKIFLLDSWKIPCELLGFSNTDIGDESGASVNNTESTTSNSTETTAPPITKPTAEHSTESTTEPTTAPTTELPHTHNFSAATCTAPKTCSCGATEGTANGHSWKDATCTAPKICEICSERSGSATKHNYSNGKCTVCGSVDPNHVEETLVWIPTHGGTKYHRKSSCSKMIDPIQVTLSEAESRGFSPCKRCH